MITKYAGGRIFYNGLEIDIIVPIENIIILNNKEGYLKHKKYKLNVCKEPGCIRYIEESIGNSCPNKEHLKMVN